MAADHSLIGNADGLILGEAVSGVVVISFNRGGRGKGLRYY